MLSYGLLTPPIDSGSKIAATSYKDCFSKRYESSDAMSAPSSYISKAIGWRKLTCSRG